MMPNVPLFMYCESTSKPSQPNEKLVINNPYSVIRTPFLPTTFSFSIVFHLLDLKLHLADRNVKLIFKNKQTEKVVLDTGVIIINKSLDEDESGIPEEVRGITGHLEFLNIELDSEGYYETEIFVDGESVSKHPIYVKGERVNA